MKQVLLTTAALLALTGSTFAADMAVKAPPAPIPAPVFSWSGCYIGAHVGGGVLHDDTTVGFGLAVAGRGAGAVAGGQLGCNYQTGLFVFGIEGEGYWSGLKVEEDSNYGPGFATSFEAKNKWDATVAARFGYALDRTLVYGKIGWAWGGFDYSSTVTTGGVVAGTAGASGTLDGLLLGVGAEYAFAPNWTTKFEYNYIGYGSKSLDWSACDGGGCGYVGSYPVSADKHIFKVGVNYLFNFGGAPVVARY
ncbi:outer membrane protein [Rhodoplanes roseus]|nr:outer membrane beta-barrel protein [Rhodoplanes roseus]